MAKLSQWDLLSGCDTELTLCTVHHPTLEEIRAVGYPKYVQYLNLLTLDIDDINEEIRNVLPEELTIFHLLAYNILGDEMRGLLQQALSFFISGKLYFSEKYGGFLIDCPGRDCEVIDADSYPEITNWIRQMNWIEIDETVVTNKKHSSKVMEIMAKLKKGRKKMQQNKKNDVNLAIPNMIGAVVAHHGGYTYQNIWSLTVYQLYDLFFRLNTKFQIGIIGQKWAAWGTDDFDFSAWYKSPSTK